jgi:hypothetical protein
VISKFIAETVRSVHRGETRMQDDLIAKLPSEEKAIYDALKQHGIAVKINPVGKQYSCRARHPTYKIDPQLCYGKTPEEAFRIMNENVRAAWPELFEAKSA